LADAPYQLVFQPEFVEDLCFWVETDRATALRVFKLIEAIARDPFSASETGAAQVSHAQHLVAPHYPGASAGLFGAQSANRFLAGKIPLLANREPKDEIRGTRNGR